MQCYLRADRLAAHPGVATGTYIYKYINIYNYIHVAHAFLVKLHAHKWNALDGHRSLGAPPYHFMINNAICACAS